MKDIQFVLHFLFVRMEETFTEAIRITQEEITQAEQRVDDLYDQLAEFQLALDTVKGVPVAAKRSVPPIKIKRTVPVVKVNPARKKAQYIATRREHIEEFIANKKAEIVNIVQHQHENRRTGADVMEIKQEENGKWNWKSLGPGIVSLGLKNKGHQFGIVFHAVYVTGEKLGVPSNYLKYADPRDCRDILCKLEELYIG